MGFAKNTIADGHAPRTYYRMTVVPLLAADVVPIRVSGLEQNTETATLPDRTIRSNGAKGIVEFEIEIPTHHTSQYNAMEAWRNEGVVVSPGYKKVVTIDLLNIHGTVVRTWPLLGCWCTGIGTTDLEMSNEGDMATTTFKMAADEIVPGS
jgi:hypothetical protein